MVRGSTQHGHPQLGERRRGEMTERFRSNKSLHQPCVELFASWDFGKAKSTSPEAPACCMYLELASTSYSSVFGMSRRTSALSVLSRHGRRKPLSSRSPPDVSIQQLPSCLIVISFVVLFSVGIGLARHGSGLVSSPKATNGGTSRLFLDATNAGQTCACISSVWFDKSRNRTWSSNP